jgi:predicted GTPase
LPRNAIIMGAAGRDFHNFNVVFREKSEFNVVAFTASQVPFIEDRIYPVSLAGKLYPKGIPIYPEEKLAELISERGVKDVYFSYSDVSDEYVMHRAAIVQSAGASFHLLGPRDTMIRAKKPVVAVVAVRTGAGKSTISRRVADILKRRGLRPVVVRHPMPYGDLSVAVQRFAKIHDLDRFHTTIEEREEYEGHLNKGFVVYAGVDYGAILDQAEKEGDVILWDGGNNDFSFYQPDLNIVVVDPTRAGDESGYYPGETNMRMADIIVINKVNLSDSATVERLVKVCHSMNSDAKIVKTRSVAVLDKPEYVRGKRVLVVEDGPSVTHGGLSEGAGATAARSMGATVVSPRRGAVGSIAKAYENFPNLGDVLPALGYSGEQLRELEQSIDSVDCDAVVLGTPSDLTRLIRIRRPVARVWFEAVDEGEPTLEQLLIERLESGRLARK